MTEDKLTSGECKEQTVNQWIAPLDSCDAMCGFPVQTGIDTTREASEGPNPTTFFESIGAEDWIDFGPNKVYKCFKEGEPYKIWTDEKIDWNEKKKDE